MSAEKKEIVVNVNIASLIDKVVIVSAFPEASLEELQSKIKEALKQAVETACFRAFREINQETQE